MLRKSFHYILAYLLLVTLLVLFVKSYGKMSSYSGMLNRHVLVSKLFQDISKELRSAAVLHPAMVTVAKHTLFDADTNSIKRNLDILRKTVRDSEHIKISALLDTILYPNVSWIYNSNVPDSLFNNRSQSKVVMVNKSDSLLEAGILRSQFLINMREEQISAKSTSARNILIIFVLVASVALLYTTIGLFRERSGKLGKEEELRILFERISDGVIALDREWRYTFLNSAAKESQADDGKSRIGAVIWDIYPELKNSVVWDKYHQAVNSAEVVEFESFYNLTGTWFDVKAYPSQSGLTIFYKNITDKKKAEELLNRSRLEIADYKFAIDEASIVAITDQSGVIKHANDNFCKISKYSREELIGQDHRIISSGFHDKEFIRNLWKTIANGKIWKGELRNKAKDDSIYWVDTTIVPFLDYKGKPYQYLAIRADITERKKIEQQLIDLNRDLENKVLTRTQELQRVNQELEAFTYSVSHDLRAPLRGILGFTSILEEEYAPRLDQEAERITSVIRNSTLKMGRLIDDLLAFSRTGKQNLSKTEINMNALVEEVRTDLLCSSKQKMSTGKSPAWNPRMQI